MDPSGQWGAPADQYRQYPQPVPPPGQYQPAPGNTAYGAPPYHTGQYNTQLPPSSAPYGHAQQYNTGAGMAPPMPTGTGMAPPPSGAYSQSMPMPGPRGTAPYPPSAPVQQPAGAPQSQFSLMNPWSMLTSVSQMGQNVQASQQFVSSQVTWFTGGFFQQLFQVDPKYVGRKLGVLLAPYLHSLSYIRQVDNITANAPVMKPPSEDLFAPDLYIPLFSFFTYVLLAACNKFANGHFSPDSMYAMVSWAAAAWVVNFAVMWILVRLMYLGSPPPALEVLAYSGYSFVSFCLSTLCGWAFGRGFGWHIAWLYTSACMSVFLIRTFKNIIRIDVAQRGEGTAGRHRMYLLLAMGGAQFVVSWICGFSVTAVKTAGKA